MDARARMVVAVVAVAAIAGGGALWRSRADAPTRPSAVASGGSSATVTDPPAVVVPPGGSSAPSAGASGPGGATSVATSAPVRPAAAFPMRVRYVYDGDTLQLQHAEPNEVVTTTNPSRVRLVGVDTPEATPAAECWSGEATALLRKLAPVGARVWVAPDRDSWDDHGRRLFAVWTDDGRFVEGELVSAGAAKAIRIWPNVAHHAYLSALEERAADARVGLWGRC